MQLSQNIWRNEKLIKILKEGGIVIMPTDTVYGLVGEALNLSTVNRIYNIKKRTPEKPCIILIGGIDELEKFSIVLSQEQKKIIEDCVEPTSFILDCPLEEFKYLHRGTNTLAFRLPLDPNLKDLLLQTGPLVAPSANPEGLPPAKKIPEAREYFADTMDLYIDGGEIEGKPSKLIKINKNGEVQTLRS